MRQQKAGRRLFQDRTVFRWKGTGHLFPWDQEYLLALFSRFLESFRKSVLHLLQNNHWAPLCYKVGATKAQGWLFQYSKQMLSSLSVCSPSLLPFVSETSFDQAICPCSLCALQTLLLPSPGSSGGAEQRGGRQRNPLLTESNN